MSKKYHMLIDKRDPERKTYCGVENHVENYEAFYDVEPEKHDALCKKCWSNYDDERASKETY